MTVSLSMTIIGMTFSTTNRFSELTDLVITKLVTKSVNNQPNWLKLGSKHDHTGPNAHMHLVDFNRFGHFRGAC